MSVCHDEYVSIQKDLSTIQIEIAACPQGSLRKREIKGRYYYYLQHREGKQVKSLYVTADEAPQIQIEIEHRKDLEQQAKDLRARLSRYAKLLGVHNSYRPIKNVDYEDYTLFMSSVAHDYKRLDFETFIEKYDVSKYRGINKRYLAGFLDYINGIESQSFRKTNDLVLDPYTYQMYYKYGNKEVLQEELKRAIPAFLKRGLLITSVQEAVNGALSE